MASYISRVRFSIRPHYIKMRGPFFLFAAFACTLTQNSLEVLASTSSSTSRIQTDMATDYSAIEALKTVAGLKYQKLVDNIFNHLEDLAKLACEGQNLPENSANITNTTKAEMLAAFTTQFDVTLLAILSINPEAYSEISALRVSGHASIQIVIDNIYQGFHLAQKKNSSGFLKEIEALENKTLAAALTANNMIYSAFRCGEGDLPKIGAAISDAQKKSAVQDTIAVRKAYHGIKALQVATNSEHQVGCEIVFRTIKSAGHQTSSAVKSDNEIKFGLVEKLLSAVFVIQSGFMINFSTIQAIQTAAVSDYENAMNGIYTITRNNSSKVSTENGNGNMSDSDGIRTAQQAANIGIQMAVAIFFDKIKSESAKLEEGNQLPTDDEYCKTEITQNGGYIAFTNAIDYHFKAILIAQPEASLAVTRARRVADASLIKCLEGIEAALKLIHQKYSVNLPAKIEAIEEISVSAAVGVIENIFYSIKNGRKTHTQIGTAIQRAEEKSVSLVVRVFRTFFTGIKILLTEAFPEYEIECDDCCSSIDAVQKEASDLFAAEIRTVFDVIETLSQSSYGVQIGKADHPCGCATV